jgi:hypothetical protein
LNVDPDPVDTGDCRGNTRDLLTHLGFLRKRRLNIDENGAISSRSSNSRPFADHGTSHSRLQQQIPKGGSRGLSGLESRTLRCRVADDFDCTFDLHLADIDHQVVGRGVERVDAVQRMAPRRRGGDRDVTNV